jgi:hypothetical protein
MITANPILFDRFFEKVEITETCWLWTGAKLKTGYGCISFETKLYRAHRLIYELLIAPVLDGFDVDHVCHNTDVSCMGGPSCPHRLCVNPYHLAAVSHAENVARGRAGWRNAEKTHCPQGHEYTEDNIYMVNDGKSRKCKRCAKESGAVSAKNRPVKPCKDCGGEKRKGKGIKLCDACLMIRSVAA